MWALGSFISTTLFGRYPLEILAHQLTLKEGITVGDFSTRNRCRESCLSFDCFCCLFVRCLDDHTMIEIHEMKDF